MENEKEHIVTCKGVCVTKITGYRLDGVISTLVASSLNHTYYSTIADLLNLQITVAHTSIFSFH
jgi:hypothetical protein